ncbi:MAG: peptidoglycan DD-metalloendopeptidase family protein [Cellvibrionales bacterium]|nr:peptidoglycan DD-metalloendopeptidase family protein [Cellvibrionales bacterium]
MLPSTNQLSEELKLFPFKHLLVLASLLLFIVLIALVEITQHNTKVLLPVAIQGKPIFETTPQVPSTSDAIDWKETKVRSGDNLAKIFGRVNLSETLLANLLNDAPDKKLLTKLMPGETFRFGFKDKSLQTVEYIQSPLQKLTISVKENNFNFENIIREPDVRLTYKSADVTDSLFLSAIRADINDNLTMAIADIFSGVIDFALDVRPNDKLDVLYETLYLDDKIIGLGNIVATSYTNDGETHTAYRYTLSSGKSGYFDSEGNSMRKPFLRAPLDFTRISSNFNLKRKHPIHKKIKAHRGTDYAAPTGTPVFAAGDGRVTRAGYTKANGNYVIIQHGQSYTTKYLHLHKRHVKRGQKVSQRQIIGTVGSTGYATGPHLHYEFLMHGVHRNPRTIINKLPSADPIPKKEMPEFLESIKAVQLQYSNYQSQAF